VAKVRPISGFPEWLPAQRLAEQQVLDRIREAFERFGFTPIETRAVEPLDWLLSKGETDKEIYVLRRLQAEAAEGERGGGEPDDAGLGLHFDLTVPFARYVAQNRARLAFPFRRYQIQKSWRGEKPQEGRYREFYQADADVIAEGELPLAYDAEMVEVLHEVTAAMPIPAVTVRINHRKVLEGFYRGLGVADPQPALRAADKLDKIGEQGVRELLAGEVGLDAAAAGKALELAGIRGADGASIAARVRALGVAHELLDRGLEELAWVLGAVAHLPAGAYEADLKIARGLDYYTGIVYEGTMAGYESLGAVCSGGRYDDLAAGGAAGGESGGGGGPKLPGTGISIGVSRILGKLFADGALGASRATPACVLVALTGEELRAESLAVARALRRRGIPCEVHPTAQKYGKQIRHAERKGIPYVWFPRGEATGGHEVRDIVTGEQAAADPERWQPPEEKRRVRLVTAGASPKP
jgi:histidyl-tRNA synthetase